MQLPYKKIRGGLFRPKFRLTEDVTVMFYAEKIRIAKGTEIDGATFGFLVFWKKLKYIHRSVGVLIHDEGYKNLGRLTRSDGSYAYFSRKELDEFLIYDLEENINPPDWSSKSAYIGVRFFGWFLWQKRRFLKLLRGE